MKRLLTLLLSIFSYTLFSQSYTEGPDLSNTATGPVFNFTAPSITISGEMNTPGDGSEYFMIDIPSGCQINGVNYSITDPASLNITGYFQFGINNQESYTGATSGSFNNATQFPTTPFPLSGPASLQCQAQANIAFMCDWSMVFNGSCGSCIKPVINSLTTTASLVCPGDSATLNINGSLNDATAWHIYESSCGGTFVGSTTSGSFKVLPVGSSTDYYVRGEGGCVSPGPCLSVQVQSQDLTPPILNCPDTHLIYINNNCKFIMPDFSLLVTHSDNCDPSPVFKQFVTAGSEVSNNSINRITSTDARGNIGECIINIVLKDTINPIDVSVTQNSTELTANNSNASAYQWLNCNDGLAVISGENSPGCTFCKTYSGDYAVEITVQGCRDTSDCYSVSTGIAERNFNSQVVVSPNPIKNSFTVDFGQIYPEVNLIITDIYGRIVQEDQVMQRKVYSSSFNQAAGIYLLNLHTGNEQAVIKIIKE